MAEYIFRRGTVNAVFGLRGIGKTWVATGAAAQFLRDGEEVAWFCWACPIGPDSASACLAQLYHRLGKMGVGDRINHLHHYPNPPADWWKSNRYLFSPSGLVVFDGVEAVSMTEDGESAVDDQDEYVMASYLKPFHTAENTATVIMTEAQDGDDPSFPDQVPRLYHLNDGTDVEGPDDGGEMTRLRLDEMFYLGGNSPADHTYRIV